MAYRLFIEINSQTKTKTKEHYLVLRLDKIVLLVNAIESVL